MTEVMDPQNEAAQFVALSKAIDLRFFIQMGLKAEVNLIFEGEINCQKAIL